MATLLEQAIVKLSADSGELVREFRRANSKATDFGRKMDKTLGGVERSFRRLGTGIKFLAGGFLATALGRMIHSSLEAQDAIGKLAQRLGATTEGISSLQFAAEQTGVGINTLNLGLQRMVRRVAEAADGSGEAKGALRELGLEAGRLKQLRPEDQFAAIADAMQDVRSQSDQVRLAMKLFDSEGVALIQTMQGGAGRLREFRKEAEQLGIVIGQDQANAAAAAIDSLNRVNKAFAGVATTTAVELAPELEGLGNFLSQNIPTAARAAMDALAKLRAFSVDAAGRSTAVISELQERQARMIREQGSFIAKLTEGVQSTPLGVALQLFGKESDNIARSFENAAAESRKQAESLLGLAEAYRITDGERQNFQRGSAGSGFTPGSFLGGGSVETEGEREERLKVIADLTKRLATEEERINMVYERQRQLILDNVSDQEMRMKLLGRNQQQQVDALNDLWEKQDEGMQRAGNNMTAFAEQAARNVQDNFANFLFSPLDDGFKGMADNFSNSLRRMSAEFLSSQLLALVGGSLVGSANPFVSSFGNFLQGGGPEGKSAFTPTGANNAALAGGFSSDTAGKSLASPGDNGPQVVVYSNDRAKVERSPDGRLLEVFVGEVNRQIAQGGSVGKTISQTFGASARGQVS